MKTIKPFFNSLTFAVLAALISGVLTFFSDYPNPIAVFAWIAPIPVLYAGIRRGFPDAWWLGLLYVIPGYLGAAFFNMPSFIPVPVRVGFFLVYIISFEMIFLLTIFCIQRLGLAYAGWINAALLTVGLLVQELPVIGHWAPLASTQSYADWIRPVASVGGDYLIGFIIFLFAGTVAAILLEQSRRVIVSSAAGFIFVIAVVIAGNVSIASYNKTSQVKVAAFSHNYTVDMEKRLWHHNMDKLQSADTWNLFDLYEKSTRKAASEGVRLVAWPEYALWVKTSDLPEFMQRLEKLSHDTGIAIVAGYVDAGNLSNNAIIIGPDGEREVYLKYNLAQGGEIQYLKRGTKPYGSMYLKALKLKVAVRICYDNDFPLENRLAAIDGADIFFAPSADEINSAERHAMLHIMRSAENGIPMIRATLSGTSLIAGADGKVIAQALDTKPGGAVYVTAELPIVKGETFYKIAGNWIVVFSGLMLIAFTIIYFRDKNR